jgi:hypothetical protein
MSLLGIKYASDINSTARLYTVYLYYCYIYCFVRTHAHLYSRIVVLFALFGVLL